MSGFSKQRKWARSQILLNSAHTHSAPMLGDQDRTESGVAREDARNIVAYTRSLQDKLVQVATQALSRLEPAQLSWSSGVAHFAMNRREFTPRGVILGVNPRGPVDRTVPVLQVDSAEGKLRAILFGYACHNTTLTQTNYNLCGDYAGFAQAYIQERQPGAQAMFMIGCGGDPAPTLGLLFFRSVFRCCERGLRTDGELHLTRFAGGKYVRIQPEFHVIGCSRPRCS